MKSPEKSPKIAHVSNGLECVWFNGRRRNCRLAWVAHIVVLYFYELTPHIGDNTHNSEGRLPKSSAPLDRRTPGEIAGLSFGRS